MQTAYYLGYDSANDAEAVISKLRIVGSSTTPTGIDTSLYHFHFYFIIHNTPPRSVTLDTVIGADFTCSLVVKSTTSVTDDAPNADPISYDVPLRSTETSIPTIGNVLARLVEGHFDRYQYTGEGDGSAHWCYKVLQWLEGEEVTADGYTAGFMRWVREMHTILPAHVAAPWVEGTFY